MSTRVLLQDSHNQTYDSVVKPLPQQQRSRSWRLPSSYAPSPLARSLNYLDYMSPLAKSKVDYIQRGTTTPRFPLNEQPIEEQHIEIADAEVIPSNLIVTAKSPREGLPRWPGLTTPTGILRCLDWFGTVVFAVSGALTAAMCGANLLGCILIGTITAIGGGTLRDSIVLCKQPFWVEESEYVFLSIIPAALAFYFWGVMEPGQEIVPFLGLTLKGADGGEGTAMQWGDAIGVGAFAVIGAMNGIRSNCPYIVCALCGMMTATFGGMVRDGLLQHPVRIMHSYADAYASIAFVCASLYMGMRKASPQRQGLRIFVCVLLAIILRNQAWTYGWRLPYWATNSENVATGVEHP
ncbi:hypothetical protein THRCLA_05894 [Thraustotheca clavata]|uniref:Glycine transporter domain-containing protein n=1 Tax=Thraustotheca clavata TaxID=74557 RepID=A0A1V9ZRW2_9STRA|nr:hypothetical protein THRCLA_05894 [Thraustotheca clavata]